MKKSYTLELSVLRAGSAGPYRAVLWDGWLTKSSDAVVLGVTYTHPNFFAAVREIKKTVLVWSKHSQIKTIAGIHDSTACWPIDTSIEIERAVEETEHLTREQCGLGFVGIFGKEGVVSGHLHTKCNSPTFEFAKGIVGQPLWTDGINLFGVSELLFHSIKSSLPTWGVERVNGLQDEDACWPEVF